MKTSTIIAATALTTLLSLAAPHAAASITGVTGATVQLGSPPVSCNPGALTGFTAYAWDEQTNIPLSVFGMDMTNNPGTSNAPLPGPVSGAYDSHFIHFEPLPGAVGVSGTVTFSSPIVACDFRALSLDSTDALLGSPGTTYPTTYPFRGISSQSMFAISGNTLTFNLFVMAPTVDVAQIRVITHAAPAPGAAALLGAAGLLTLRRRRRV
jgi:MYXO-CTERM domain-containing protein